MEIIQTRKESDFSFDNSLITLNKNSEPAQKTQQTSVKNINDQ